MLRAALAEIERQRLIIAALQRNRFGRRSEQLDDATVQHGVEDLEQSVAEQTAAVEAAMPPAKPAATGAAARPPRTEPAKRNRGALPAHLPRVELVVDVEDKACPCCGGTLHVIGVGPKDLVTSTYCYKRPPRKRKAVAVGGAGDRAKARRPARGQTRSHTAAANDEGQAAIVTAKRRPGGFGEVPDMAPEEHQRRGEAANTLFREIVRRATE